MKTPRIWERPHPIRLLVRSRMGVAPAGAGDGFCPSHRHDFYELGLVLGGECQWRIGRRRVTLRRGQAILVKARSAHAERVPAGATEVAWIGVDFRGRAPAWAERPVTLGGDFEEVAAAFEAIARERTAADALTARRIDLALQNVFLLVTRHAENRAAKSRGSRPSPLNPRQVRSVEAAARHFRQHFRDALSVAQVAAAHSFCPAYFSTLFRAHYQVPPRVYLRQAKLEKARELLETSEMTIKAISDACGFVDASHFTKAFRRAWRLTPGAYRAR
ncbi:MAG: AraC family transcriptional regulator [Verrucomicrobiota bacterium]